MKHLKKLVLIAYTQNSTSHKDCYTIPLLAISDYQKSKTIFSNIGV